MNVAVRPARTAISLIAVLSRKPRSAASSARPWPIVISYCEFENSCVAVVACRPSCSHEASMSSTTPRGSDT
jgi:hypothetical protein